MAKEPRMRPFPFSAVVGMPELRLALLLNAVSPTIGGVLVRGEKGTAKSTAVRALAAVLPPVAVLAGCRFSCDPAAPDPDCPDGPHPGGPHPGGPHPAGTAALYRPARLVELPVGAAEDRLVGALDLERALAEGVTAFQPGLLAAAHRGVLYVDEVNLLHDHLVDLLLDAAALGTSYVEREGVSVRHAARFLLVGTMNPEEGEIRPQLLDRFGLTVEVGAPRDTTTRAEVVRRRLAYDADPDGFVARFAAPESELAAQIVAAQARLPGVTLPDGTLEQIASVCAAFDVDGMRADIVIARTALAHAAWHDRPRVGAEDVRVAARLALPHRRRRNPFDAPGLDEQQLDDALRDADPDPADPDPADPGPDGAGPDDSGPPPTPPPDGPGPGSGSGPPDDRTGTPPPGDGTAPQRATGPDRVAAPTAPFRARRLEVPGVGAGADGRRSRARGAGTGHLVRTSRPVRSGGVTRPHLPATLLAAVPHQHARGRLPGAGAARPLRLRRDDLRVAHREGREGNLVLFAVDASGSMAARSRMGAVKGAVLSLLLDAYQRRDKVGLISFRGTGAELLLPPTSSVDAAAARLTRLPTGGRTPLAAGLLTAYRTLRRERLRDPRRRALLVVVTDGRHTSGADPARAAALLVAERLAASVVIDCEAGPVRLGLAGRLAGLLDGVLLRPGQLAAGPLADSVRAIRKVA
jgi:magnesium chelatase subunit D